MEEDRSLGWPHHAYSCPAKRRGERREGKGREGGGVRRSEGLDEGLGGAWILKNGGQERAK